MEPTTDPSTNDSGAPDAPRATTPTTVLDVTVPVYNEAHVLESSIATLHAYLSAHFPFSWRITVVDNASTDATLEVATRCTERFTDVHVLHLDRKGRGLALREAWTRSDAQVCAYMDVDLSTGLDALLPLVAPLITGHSDMAIGSRLAPGASVARGPRREIISRTYNVILRTVFAVRFRDAQCGFKAVRTDIARHLLPAVEDNGWFFDTELLLMELNQVFHLQLVLEY
jgi:glycosyltransferase involved in cell wall biosynthesis